METHFPSALAYSSSAGCLCVAPDVFCDKAARPRMTSSQAINHVAWNCDGKKLAAVGIDKLARVWNPDKSVRLLIVSTLSFTLS